MSGREVQAAIKAAGLPEQTELSAAHSLDSLAKLLGEAALRAEGDEVRIKLGRGPGRENTVTNAGVRRLVRKADPVACYDAQGNLIGLVDPAKLQAVQQGKPVASGSAHGASAGPLPRQDLSEPTELTPQDSAKVGTAADAVGKAAGKSPHDSGLRSHEQAGGYGMGRKYDGLDKREPDPAAIRAAQRKIVGESVAKIAAARAAEGATPAGVGLATVQAIAERDAALRRLRARGR